MPVRGASRSARNSLDTLEDGAPSSFKDAGFLDTGDVIDLRVGRCHFIAWDGSIINVGGQKLHTKEIEAVINGHPDVGMLRVTARRNPITGATVIADVAVAPESPSLDALKGEILAACRDMRSRRTVPASARFGPSIEVAAAGKPAPART